MKAPTSLKKEQNMKILLWGQRWHIYAYEDSVLNFINIKQQ